MATRCKFLSLAASAIQIQAPKTKRSKRIRAANKFLANLTLDGSISTDETKKNNGKGRTKPRPTLDKEEQEMLLNTSSMVPSLQQRPKLYASFSTTNAIEDDENSDPTGSASSTTTFHMNSSAERTYNRATSLKESKLWPNNLIFTSSKNLVKFRGLLSGKRIMLCSGHLVPFTAFSTLKYIQQEKGDALDKSTYRLRRMSGENDCDSYGIKGVDLGTQEKPVSYGHLLLPNCGLSSVSRNCLSPRRNTTVSNPGSPIPETRSSFKSSSFGSNSNIPGSSPGSKVNSPRGDNFGSSHGEQTGSLPSYDPLLLDDPELRSGRHRKVLRLTSFMVSIIEYAKPSQLKKDLNEQFKEKFPNMEITLSKLRSLKHDLVKLSLECSLDHSTVALAFVYFEKLVLWGKINKLNRKLVAGSCLLLAAKFNNDLNKCLVKQLIDNISDWFRVSTTDLFLFEIQALIALEFNLHLPSSQLTPHMKRLEYGMASFVI